MKMNKVILGMAAAIGLASTNVMALPLSQYDATGTNTLRVFASGASAQDQGFERWFRLQCAAGTLDIYRDGSNQRMFFCNINSTGIPGFPTAALGGKKVAMFKSSVGGSGNGVQPVANQTPLLGFLNPPNLTGCVTTAVPASGAFGAYNDHVCTPGALQNAVSDVGISDVEPKLFNASDAEVGRLAISSQNAVIWGVPVTTNLRNALQTAQGLVAGSDTEANMPTLSRQQVTSLYVGQLTSWDDFTDPTGAGIATTAGLADPTVYLCRRVNSSGTQASFEVNFLRQRCISGAPSMSSALSSPTTVTEGSGTSNVISCLNNHNTAGRWAIGLFSTENQEGTGGWRFVKVDGRAPTLLSVVKGGYPYFSEQSIQWRKPGFNPPIGLTLTLLNNFKSEMGSPAIIANLNQGFNHTWGQSGLLALPTNGHFPPATPYTAANVTATPVSSQSKSYVDGSPNNCLEPALFAPQLVGG